MTIVTMMSASISVLITSLMELVMLTVPSYAIFCVTPVGSCPAIPGSAARTRCVTSSRFAFGATLMPTKPECWPEKATLKS